MGTPRQLKVGIYDFNNNLQQAIDYIGSQPEIEWEIHVYANDDKPKNGFLISNFDFIKDKEITIVGHETSDGKYKARVDVDCNYTSDLTLLMICKKLKMNNLDIPDGLIVPSYADIELNHCSCDYIHVGYYKKNNKKGCIIIKYSLFDNTRKNKDWIPIRINNTNLCLENTKIIKGKETPIEVRHGSSIIIKDCNISKDDVVLESNCTLKFETSNNNVNKTTEPKYIQPINGRQDLRRKNMWFTVDKWYCFNTDKIDLIVGFSDSVQITTTSGEIVTFWCADSCNKYKKLFKDLSDNFKDNPSYNIELKNTKVTYETPDTRSSSIKKVEISTAVNDSISIIND